MDRCLKIEHARFHGGLHLAGFDTGVINSRRRRGERPRTRHDLHAVAELSWPGRSTAPRERSGCASRRAVSARSRSRRCGWTAATWSPVRRGCGWPDDPAPAGRRGRPGRRGAGRPVRRRLRRLPEDPLEVDEQAAVELARWLATGEAALRGLAPDQTPVLWPEHFDLSITVDEVNYGVSLGDGFLAEPYAYVGPWAHREGISGTPPSARFAARRSWRTRTRWGRSSRPERRPRRSPQQTQQLSEGSLPRRGTPSARAPGTAAAGQRPVGVAPAVGRAVVPEPGVLPGAVPVGAVAQVGGEPPAVLAGAGYRGESRFSP
jgi:hypothetical protein